MKFFELTETVPSVYQLPCAYTSCGLANLLFSNYPSLKEESTCSNINCEKPVFEKSLKVINVKDTVLANSGSNFNLKEVFDLASQSHNFFAMPS